MELCKLEFPLAQAMELRKQLEEKHARAWATMTGNTNGTWNPSWSTNGLIERHETDANFRVCYYTFVLISTIFIAWEKNTKKAKRGDMDLETTIHTRHVAIDLAKTLDRRIHIREFNDACNAVNVDFTDSTPPA